MARIPRAVPTSRLNLEMTEDSRKKLEDLRTLTNADSLSEVIRRALAVYDFIWQEKASGRKLLVKDSEGERELVLL
jgi:hypothetical protein